MNKWHLKYSCTLLLIWFISFKGNAQETEWKGFMDFNTLYSDDALSFNMGQLDIYVTSDITDNISFLNENTFSVTEDGNFVVAVERAIAKYEVDHYFNFLIGKHHIPVSYWNDTYHHGRVLQPSAGRPLVFTKRLFPMHITGVMIMGDYIGERNFGYNVMIANGRGSTPLKDNDKNKAIGFTTSFNPIDDFKLTGGIFVDKISAGVANLQDTVLSEDVSQRLFSLTATYLPTGKKFEFLSEFFMVNNDSKSVTRAMSAAGYVHLGYSLGKMTPYYRYDYIEIDNNDPFFDVDDIIAHTLGLRYSFNFLANIKLEYQVSNYEIRKTENLVLLQFGIGF